MDLYCIKRNRNEADLWFLPLHSAGLADLEVNPLDSLGAAHDLDAAQEGLKVVEDALGQVQEGGEAGIVRHVLRQVGEKNRHVEADVLGWFVEALDELFVVEHVVLVGLGAGQQELDLGLRVLLLVLHGLLKLLLGDESFAVGVLLLEVLGGGQIFQLEEHVEELEDHLHVVGGLH